MTTLQYDPKISLSLYRHVRDTIVTLRVNPCIILLFISPHIDSWRLPDSESWRLNAFSQQLCLPIKKLCWCWANQCRRHCHSLPPRSSFTKSTYDTSCSQNQQVSLTAAWDHRGMTLRRIIVCYSVSPSLTLSILSRRHWVHYWYPPTLQVLLLMGIPPLALCKGLFNNWHHQLSFIWRC